MSERRPHNVNTRMSADEHAMLKALSERLGLSASDVVRQLVRSAYAEKYGSKPPRKRR